MDGDMNEDRNGNGGLEGSTTVGTLVLVAILVVNLLILFTPR